MDKHGSNGYWAEKFALWKKTALLPGKGHTGVVELLPGKGVSIGAINKYNTTIPRAKWNRHIDTVKPLNDILKICGNPRIKGEAVDIYSPSSMIVDRYKKMISASQVIGRGLE